MAVGTDGEEALSELAVQAVHKGTGAKGGLGWRRGFQLECSKNISTKVRIGANRAGKGTVVQDWRQERRKGAREREWWQR